MFEWIETRWIITAAVVVVIIILLDELAYHHWKKTNPGALYTHLRNRPSLTPIDPTRPPTTYYE